MLFPAAPDSLSPSSFARWMRWGMVVFNLLIVGLAGWGLYLSHRHSVERAFATTQNLAQVLEENVKGTIRQINLGMLAARDEAQRGSGRLEDPALGAFIGIRFRRLATLDALRVVDAEGRVVHRVPAAAAPEAPGGADFLRALRESADGTLIISPPAREGAGGAPAITLAQRISGPHGEFRGAICATLATEQLARAMARVDVGRWGSVSLRDENLRLLVRYPAFEGLDRSLGQRPAGPYLENALAPGSSAQFTADSTLDGRRRTYSVRKLDAPPFQVQVGLAQQEYLRAWRHEALFAAVAVAALVSLSVAMGWLARAAWLRQLSDQERLAFQEVKYRLLAENALDVIWTSDSEGNLTYISPSVFQQRGWTPDEFLALSLEDRAPSAHGAQRFRERIAEARTLPLDAPTPEMETFEATVRHRDGRELEVEVRSRIVRSPDGRVLGLQGASRDVTDRRRMEAERDKLIQELTGALGQVRALSGLLPICSHCKKVRDDQGYWNQIEAYLGEHTDATFTHGVCPECATIMRQEMQARREQRDGPKPPR
ncbi:PAS domain S-box protein [Geothrix sp. 21YS21S-4]|uniref:PAS domain S-box protein n=1 Tax=Geothrix sp. 21YS21S-4 TaxID=3068889 RepID=UPI0027BAB7E8|nr:PAS domain S-box protein [Geothrix sp. 21YS21S-4]